MTIKLLNPVWLPRPATKYSGCYPLGFEKYIPELIKTSNFIHFFGGKAKTGFRVDINENVDPDLLANVENLSGIENESFDGGFADPPYNKQFAEDLYHCLYPKWSLWTKELVRVVKKGGYIGIMQNYIVPKLPQCKYISVFPILLRIKQFPKIVTIQRKIE